MITIATVETYDAATHTCAINLQQSTGRLTAVPAVKEIPAANLTAAATVLLLTAPDGSCYIVGTL